MEADEAAVGRFVYAMCRARWPGRTADAYHRKVKRLKPARLQEIADIVWGADAEGVELRLVADTLHLAITSVLFAERADVAEFTVRDRTFLLTGGIVRGGWDPTEAFELIRLLDVSRVTLVRDEDAGPYKRAQEGVPGLIEAETAVAIEVDGEEHLRHLQELLDQHERRLREALAETDILGNIG